MSSTGIAVAASPAPTSPQAACNSVVLIADEIARDRLAKVIQQEEFSVSVFADVDALLGQPSEHSPSLIVLWIEDIVSGLLGCIEQLAQRFTGTPVVLVCPSIERWEVRPALMAGIAGIVLSESLDSTLGPCLRAVQAGQTCVPREHWRQIEPPALSAREKQVLGLVVMGYMNSQIAEQLYLAESTVKSHLSSAFGKLGVRSRNEAVNLILDPERGYGMGILALGGEPLDSRTVVAQ